MYIETEGKSDLNVGATITTLSRTAREGGIVLIGGGELNIDGKLFTQSTIGKDLNGKDLIRIQVVDKIGREIDSTDDSVRYVGLKEFDAGQGLPPGDPFLTTTEFVIRQSEFGLSATAEDFRTHILQRVVLQFGFAGEAGFVTYIGYADGAVQQFDVQGEVGAKTATFNELNMSDIAAIQAVPDGSSKAAAFTRQQEFQAQFLDSNQMLPTQAVVRRAADFFLFENAGHETEEAIDLTFETESIDGVVTLGAQGATEMPPDAPPVLPPPPIGFTSTTIEDRAAESPQAELELAIPQERKVEVAIYRVFYDDENENGQPENRELPDGEAIVAAKTIDETANTGDDIKFGERLRIETIQSADGGTPTNEEIAEIKQQYLDDETKESGAYAIVEKGVDEKETVLDVFSVRDQIEQDNDDDVQTPLIVDPEGTSETNRKVEGTERQSPERSEESEAGEQPVDLVDPKDQSSYLPESQAEGARTAATSSLGVALWYAKTFSTQRVPINDAISPDGPPIAFHSRARRMRRLQRKRGES